MQTAEYKKNQLRIPILQQDSSHFNHANIKFISSYVNTLVIIILPFKILDMAYPTIFTLLIKKNPHKSFYFSNAWTTALALRFLKSVYVWPVPTNTIGWPVVYVIEMAAPTCKCRNVNYAETELTLWKEEK